MTTKVPIEIFYLGHMTVDKEETKRWLKFKGVSDEYIDNLPFQEDDESSIVTDNALAIGLAAKRCYMAFEPKLNPNVEKVRNDWTEYLDNILKSGHGSVLEHGVWRFAIENVSRVFTGEMNRHRAGWAISEGSMRFIRFGESVPYWEPTSIQGPESLTNIEVHRLRNLELHDLFLDFRDGTYDTLEEKKHATRVLFSRAFELQSEMYRVLELIWADELAPQSKFKYKKEITSMMRRIIGMGCATGGVWTGNLRGIRHVIGLRCDPSAEEEILHVFSRIIVEMKKREPMIFGDFQQDDNGYWYPKYKKV